MTVIDFYSLPSVSKEESQNLLFTQPVFLEKIWGGRRLETMFGYSIPPGPIGECWAISAHPHGDCKVINGKYRGEFLSEVWKQNRALFLRRQGGSGPLAEKVAFDVAAAKGTTFDVASAEAPHASAANLKSRHEDKRFPLLVKIIDAEADLSVQVHPDDAYAMEHENGSLGKQECWYVLAAEPGATIIVGQKARSKEEFKELMTQGKWGDLLNEIPIKKGDFFQIDPGTVHAIKGGTMVLETQQSSDVTYRLYDYDRLDDEGNPRPLHIQQSLDVVNFERPLTFDGALQLSKDGVTLLEKNKNYTVQHIALQTSSANHAGKATHENHTRHAAEAAQADNVNYAAKRIEVKNEAGFLCVSVISGEATVKAKPAAHIAFAKKTNVTSEIVRIAKGDHFICPATISSLMFAGDAELIISHP